MLIPFLLVNKKTQFQSIENCIQSNSDLRAGPDRKGQVGHVRSLRDRAGWKGEEAHPDDAAGPEPGLEREVLLRVSQQLRPDKGSRLGRGQRSQVTAEAEAHTRKRRLPRADHHRGEF